MATKPAIGDPDSVSALVKIQNTKTEALRDAKAAPKKDERYVLSLELLAQDHSLQNTNQVAKVLLSDPGFFRGVKLEELIKPGTGKKASGNVQERVCQSITNMLKFNVHLECLLAFNKSGHLEIRDTELKEY